MKTKRQLPESGEVYQIPYPFVREKVSLYDGDELTWRPGIRMVPCRDDAHAEADGMGEQIISIIATFKPGKFPLRVFYTRKWSDPDRKVFGKDRCRVTTIHAFRSLVDGYRHKFKLVPKLIVEAK